MTELQSPEIFRNILDSLQTGVCVVDREGKILFWNQGAAHVSGYMQHEVIGHSCEQVMQCQRENQGDSEHDRTSPFTRILHEGKATAVGVYLRHKRGHSVPMLCTWLRCAISMARFSPLPPVSTRRVPDHNGSTASVTCFRSPGSM